MKSSRELHDIILVYQMGKVGSTSIETSLEKQGYNILHIHSFHRPIMYDQFYNLKSKKYYFSILDRIKHKILYNYLYKQTILRTNQKVKIISLVREPISRNISMFFQGLQFPVFEMNKNYNSRFENNVNKDVFINMFLNKFDHNFGINWFDDEFKKTFGIDIYKYPFNKELGYSIICNSKIEVMILKMEKLNSLESEIKNFLEIPKFKIEQANQGDKKWYADLYKYFKDKFSPTEGYINNLYNSKYMRHFYTQEEILNFKEKWIK